MKNTVHCHNVFISFFLKPFSRFLSPKKHPTPVVQGGCAPPRSCFSTHFRPLLEERKGENAQRGCVLGICRLAKVGQGATPFSRFLSPRKYIYLYNPKQLQSKAVAFVRREKTREATSPPRYL